MHDICTYYVEVQEQIDENVFNNTSPLQITIVVAEQKMTLFTICTDQSGLVGLIRHLHRRGFVLLSLSRKRQMATV